MTRISATRAPKCSKPAQITRISATRARNEQKVCKIQTKMKRSNTKSYSTCLYVVLVALLLSTVQGAESMLELEAAIEAQTEYLAGLEH